MAKPKATPKPKVEHVPEKAPAPTPTPEVGTVRGSAWRERHGVDTQQ